MIRVGCSKNFGQPLIVRWGRMDKQRNIKSKFLSALFVICSVVILLPSFFAQASSNEQLIVGITTVKAGETVDVPITLTSNGDVAAAQMQFIYDTTALELVNVQKGASLTEHQVFSNLQNGKTIIGTMSDTTIPAGQIQLLVATFKVKETAMAQEYTVAIEDVAFSSSEAEELTNKFTTVNGNIKVQSNTQVQQPTQKSTNANLATLSISDGTLNPTFNTNTLQYNVNVQYQVTDFKVTPIVAHSGKATVTVNGNATTTVPLKVGSNTITVKVTAEDGVTSKLYTIMVIREKAESTNSSSEETGNTTSTPVSPIEQESIEQIVFPVHTAYIKGFNDGTFRPDAFVTRAQIASMLARNLPETTITAQAYTDITTASWVYADVMKVKQLGIMQGDAYNRFNPSNSITRAQMAVIAYRWIKQACEKIHQRLIVVALCQTLHHLHIQMLRRTIGHQKRFHL